MLPSSTFPALGNADYTKPLLLPFCCSLSVTEYSAMEHAFQPASTPPSDFLHMTHSSRDHRTSTNLFCPTEAQLHGASRLCPRFKTSVNTLLSLHFTFCGPQYSAIPERFPASPQLVATVCPHSLPSSNSCGSWPRTITYHWGMSWIFLLLLFLICASPTKARPEITYAGVMPIGPGHLKKECTKMAGLNLF